MSSENRGPFLTVSQFCAKHPWPTEAGLRSLIYYAEKKGFSSAFKKAAGRVLVDEAEFWRIVAKMPMDNKS